ncbi:MAG: hypothetical protein HYV63_24315 [Candidatus Schekmanbacteria bacterium]|nr:hypothetical protein [Candidatus Schekmanbacteria bacterium]
MAHGFAAAVLLTSCLSMLAGCEGDDPPAGFGASVEVPSLCCINDSLQLAASDEDRAYFAWYHYIRYTGVPRLSRTDDRHAFVELDSLPAGLDGRPLQLLDLGDEGLAALWADAPASECQPYCYRHETRMAVSHDGGVSFGGPIGVAPPGSSGGNIAQLGPESWVAAYELEGDVYFRRSIAEGLAFDNPLLVATGADPLVLPVAIDEVDVAYSAGPPGARQVAIARLSVGESRAVVRGRQTGHCGTGEQRLSDAKVTRAGGLALVWQQREKSSSASRIYYALRPDRTSPLGPCALVNGSVATTEEIDARMALTPRADLVIAFTDAGSAEDPQDSRIYYALLPAGASAFDAPLRLDDTAGQTRGSVQLANGANESIHAVWFTTNPRYAFADHLR